MGRDALALFALGRSGREIQTQRVLARHGCVPLELERQLRPVGGQGLGGRNQEFALAAAIHMEDAGNIVALSGGTDGNDGPTDAAGAIATHTTLDRAAMMGLNARAMLAGNDSYRFFEPLGDLLMTGPTGTNVNDIYVALRIVP